MLKLEEGFKLRIMKIAVLMTCHNRCEKTLRCLHSLYCLDNSYHFSIDVFLVDDGSIDNTSESVSLFYNKVFLIQGSGNLFWNRGMREAWKAAIKQDYYDYFIWLNDDTILYNDALNVVIGDSLLAGNHSIICGSFQNTENGTFSYGGKTKDGCPIFPNGTLQELFYMNGNFVLVPYSVYKKIGILDSHYWHHLGDYDYGLVARHAGLKVFVASQYVGICARNENGTNRIRKSGVGIRERLRYLNTPMSLSLKTAFYFYKKNFNIIYAIYKVLLEIIIVVFPDKVYNQYKNLFKK